MFANHDYNCCHRHLTDHDHDECLKQSCEAAECARPGQIYSLDTTAPGGIQRVRPGQADRSRAEK